MNKDKDCLIGAVVGLQQSHMLEQNRRDKEPASIETIKINWNRVTYDGGTKKQPQLKMLDLI